MIRLLKGKARILLLDDDTSMQKLVSTLLRRDGHRVDIVSSGSQAIEKLGAKEYHVLLLDVMTPTNGGFTVIQHLKQTNAALLTRVVLLTGSPESVLQTVKSDIFGIVHKPFDAQELLDTVRRVVSQ